MNQKRKVLRLAIFVFMALSLTLTTSQTLAYWAEPTDATDTATATVTIGDWQQAFPYDPDYSYQVGDLATYNGNLFEAKKSGLLRQPLSSGYKSDWNDL